MQDIVTYLTTAAANLPGIQGAIFLIAGMLGLMSVGLSMIHQVSAGRRGQGPLPATIAGIIFGSLMLSLSTVVNIVSVSFFGSVADPQIISSYTPITGDNTRIAIQALVAMINVIGWIAVARGLWRWRVGPKYDQPGWFGTGLTLVLAGSIATNLYVFADVLAVSVGAIPVGTNYFKF
jgi:hypothetical protein